MAASDLDRLRPPRDPGRSSAIIDATVAAPAPTGPGDPLVVLVDGNREGPISGYQYDPARPLAEDDVVWIARSRRGARVLVATTTPVTLPPTQEPWRVVGASGQPDFQNGWAAGAGQTPPRFAKTPGGIVFIEGVITGGTSGAIAFTLPDDYFAEGEPYIYRQVLLDGGVAGGYVSIDGAGHVAITRGTAPTAYLGFDYLLIP